GRICEYVVEGAETSTPLHEGIHLARHELASAVARLSMLSGNELETVPLKDIAMAIVVHNHVHPSGLAKIRVDVDAPKVLASILAHLWIGTLELFRHWLLWVGTTEFPQECLAHVRQCD